MTAHFAKVPPRAAADAALSEQDFRVLIAICSHVDGDGRAYPSQTCIASEAGMARKNVPRSVTRIEKAGYLRRHRRQRGSGLWDLTTYEILYGPVDESPTVPTRAAEPAALNGVKPPTRVASNIAGNGYRASRATPARRFVDFDDEASVKFEEFWNAYPSRYGNPKNPAFLIFKAVVKDGADPDMIITGARNYASYSRRNGKGQEYIAHAKTWLNQRRWEQYQREPELPKSRTGMV